MDAHRTGPSALFRSIRILLLLLAATAHTAAAQSPPPACEELARLLIGQAADLAGACLISVSRADIELDLLGATLPPAAFVSTMTFVRAGENTLVLGELALTAAERPRLLRELRAAGFALTALHRHMSGEVPVIEFVHFQSTTRDARETAQQLRQAIGPPQRATAMRGQAVVGEFGSISGIPCVQMALALGAPQSASSPGPGYCAVVSDAGLSVTVAGVDLPSDAVRHTFGFRQTPDRTSAVVTASLVLAQDALNAALKVVAEGGFDIVAMGSDRLDERPRTVTLHVQARGNPLLLAEVLRSAFER